MIHYAAALHMGILLSCSLRYSRRHQQQKGSHREAVEVCGLQPPGLKSGDSRSPDSLHTSAVRYIRDPPTWAWGVDCARAGPTTKKRENMLQSAFDLDREALASKERPLEACSKKTLLVKHLDLLCCCARCDEPSQR